MCDVEMEVAEILLPSVAVVEGIYLGGFVESKFCLSFGCSGHCCNEN